MQNIKVHIHCTGGLRNTGRYQRKRTFDVPKDTPNWSADTTLVLRFMYFHPILFHGFVFLSPFPELKKNKNHNVK